MKDYIKCIAHTHEDKKRKFWCGRQNSNMDFHFMNIDHAAYNSLNNGRLLPCKNCVKAIMEAFDITE